MFGWLKKAKKQEPKPCRHDKNYREECWTSKDGTPMVDFRCFDCGMRDSGHVYGPGGDDWNKLVICQDGIKTEQKE